MPWSTDIAVVGSPLILRLHHYWQARRGARAMPRRADIAPEDLKPLLPNLLVVDIEPAPLRVRYRLVGTTIVRYARMDCTGLSRDDFAPAIDEDFQAIYGAVLRHRQPIFGTDALHLARGGRHPYEFALFPLSSDGTTVDKCIGIDDYACRGVVDPHDALPDARVRVA